MLNVMRNHFSDSALGGISEVSWVVIAPQSIDEDYKTQQEVIGEWTVGKGKSEKPLPVKQYVHAWQM